MATNRLYAQLNKVLPEAVIYPITTTDGNMGVWGASTSNIAGVLVGSLDANNKGVLQVDGIWNLSVTDSVGGGINPGDILYFHQGTPQINNTSAGGVRCGYALVAVAANATATIQVEVGY